MDINTLFIYIGYDSFKQWLVGSLVDNLFWILILSDVAVPVRIVVDTLYGDRIKKAVSRFIRWL